MLTFSYLFRYGFICACLLLASACTSILRNPVPEEYHLDTTILGRNDLRFWGDRRSLHNYQLDLYADQVSLEKRFGGIMRREHNYLAISGGGANGAYGAGVLMGWSKTGTRPEFTMVTGISTGALTAPFAFLGSAYDRQLKEFYTTLDTSRIFDRRSIVSIVRGDSLVDSTPLASMLDKYITEELVVDLAREYRRGRSLYIGTTNLDASRPVIWNITRIADSGHAGALDLIRQVMLASASIPGVFPPVYIQVRAANGRTYEEMHVDGGTSAQMFLYPSHLDWAKFMRRLEVRGTPRAYLLRNSRFLANFDPVRPRVTDIAGRSVESLIRTQGIGDTYRIAALAQRDGVDVNLTWIPASAVRDPGNEVFDPEYMAKLFDFGFQRGLSGSAWRDLDVSKLIAVDID